MEEEVKRKTVVDALREDPKLNKCFLSIQTGVKRRAIQGTDKALSENNSQS